MMHDMFGAPPMPLSPPFMSTGPSIGTGPGTIHIDNFATGFGNRRGGGYQNFRGGGRGGYNPNRRQVGIGSRELRWHAVDLIDYIL